mmetsp:Transcript_12861/g.19267  ORF Transcript_12861/g.19267 Transcript_12861/m.19267 type:complete len:232 (+) Transcript_12861:2564-3259(+)
MINIMIIIVIIRLMMIMIHKGTKGSFSGLHNHVFIFIIAIFCRHTIIRTRCCCCWRYKVCCCRCRCCCRHGLRLSRRMIIMTIFVLLQEEKLLLRVDVLFIFIFIFSVGIINAIATKVFHSKDPNSSVRIVANELTPHLSSGTADLGSISGKVAVPCSSGQNIVECDDGRTIELLPHSWFIRTIIIFVVHNGLPVSNDHCCINVYIPNIHCSLPGDATVSIMMYSEARYCR